MGKVCSHFPLLTIQPKPSFTDRPDDYAPRFIRLVDLTEKYYVDIPFIFQPYFRGSRENNIIVPLS